MAAVNASIPNCRKDGCETVDHELHMTVRLSFLLLLKLMLVSLTLVLWAGTTHAGKVLPPRLRFSEKGKFKIVQIADMHYANGASTKCSDVLPSQYSTCSDLNTTTFLNRVIAEEKPDLLVFTGDNIVGGDCTDPAASLDAAFAPAIAAKIPWVAVLGNHDQEGTLDRAGVMGHIVGMDYTLSHVNPITGSQHIDGFGNYNLEIMGAEGSLYENKSVLNLYMLDSGDYSKLSQVSGYGWIHQTQSTWVKELSKELQEAYTTTPPAQANPAPALAYFHIPVPEYSLLDTFNFTGIKQESISSASVNSGFLTTLAEANDVKAAFVGHDHVNDFCGDVLGIRLCYAGGFGYHAYGLAGWSRRTRVVVAALQKDARGSWQDVSSIVTWKRLDDGDFTVIDPEPIWTKPGPRLTKDHF